MFSDVFDCLQGFYNHKFMMYEFVVAEDDEAMKSLCASLFVYVKNYIFAEIC
jgi:hypothetical protein